MDTIDRGPRARRIVSGHRNPAATALLFLLASMLSTQAAAADLVGPSTLDGLQATLGQVNGLQVRYYEAGSGEPLVLLHGGRLTVFNSANMWARNVTSLAQNFHVFAVDRYGYGMTGAYPDDDFTYEREVEFLLDFLDSKNLRKVHMAGNSSGAAVALLFALAHPERVSTLTLVAVGPHTPNGRSKGDIMREACDNIADSQLSWSCWMQAMTFDSTTAFGPDFFKASEYMKSLPEWQAIEARKIKGEPQSGDEYWAPYMARVRDEGAPGLPVLLVCGMHDNLDWPAGDEFPAMRGCMSLFGTLGARNKKVKFIGYNQAGHFPYREEAEQFSHDLAEFARFWAGRQGSTE